jgi:GT2 family glycosyltransferase
MHVTTATGMMTGDTPGDAVHHGTSPLLTIAIPTFNRCRWLRQALDSALLQAADDVEIIVSDNASTDGTAAMADEYQAGGVRWVTQPRNLGMVGNWEFLLDEARGRWFLLLSDDDALLPGCIAVLKTVMKDCHEPVLMGGCIFENHATGMEMPRTHEDAIRAGPDFIRSFILGEVFAVPAATILRTDFLRQVGGYRQNDFQLVVDAAAWFRIAAAGVIRTISPIVARYAVQPSSATTANNRMEREITNLYQLWSEHLGFSKDDRRAMEAGLARISTAVACRRMASMGPFQRFRSGWSIICDGRSRPIKHQLRHVLIAVSVMVGLGPLMDLIRGGKPLNGIRLALAHE